MQADLDLMEFLLTNKEEVEVEEVSNNYESLIKEKCTLEISLNKQQPEIDSKENPLLCWEKNTIRFPILSRLAKMWLAIPATSAPRERVFSLEGRIVTKERNRLSAEKVSRIMFVNSILVKNQEIKELEEKETKRNQEEEQEKKIAALEEKESNINE